MTAQDPARLNDGRFRMPNPPVHRTSTVLFDDVAHLQRALGGMVGDGSGTLYGTNGTPTTRALADLILEREGGEGVAFTPSGLGAVSLSLLAVLRSGDHLLMVDSCYGPTRGLCRDMLVRFGVETEYYASDEGAAIAERIRPNTRAIFIESPGSYTFEVQDVPAIVGAARAAERARGGDPIYVLADNAWGSPGLFAPFAHDIDVSVVPLTKYWGGHADLLLGAVIANTRTWHTVRDAAFDLGFCTNGDEAALALRGARTTDLRLQHHAASALEVAQWLAAHPRVGRVLHPALPGSPGHELWKRDFNGSNGLLSFELVNPDRTPATSAVACTVADALARDGLFGLGYSWGGYESLVMPGVVPGISHMVRTVKPWAGGALVRLHVGLEPVESLIASLERALATA